MTKENTGRPHISTSSLRASEVLLNYLTPGGKFSEDRRNELTGLLRDELRCDAPLGAIVHGTYGVHLRQELASKIEKRSRIASDVTATEVLLGYLQKDGNLSIENRDELQRILSDDMNAEELLGQILRGSYGTALRVELANRARNSKIFNS